MLALLCLSIFHQGAYIPPIVAGASEPHKAHPEAAHGDGHGGHGAVEGNSMYLLANIKFKCFFSSRNGLC